MSGTWLQWMSKRELRQALAALGPINRQIIEARYLRRRPVTLAHLGRSLGVSRQRVAQGERRAVAALLEV